MKVRRQIRTAMNTSGNQNSVGAAATGKRVNTAAAAAANTSGNTSVADGRTDGRGARGPNKISMTDNQLTENAELFGGAGGGGASFKRDTARRTLNKITDKLLGHSDTTTSTNLGIEGTVQSLLNEAQDVSNLCKIYSGWSPWL